MLNGFKIIDFHTHPYVDKNQNICAFVNDVYNPGRTIAEDMEKAGIDIFCGSVIARPLEGETLWDTTLRSNNIAIKLKDDFKGKYVPGFHINPNYVKESIEEIERMAKLNFKLCGEVVPYAHEWNDYSCKELSEILDVLKSYNMVFNFHTIDLEQIEKMVANHPKITFVAAHPGPTDNFYKHLEIMKKHENYYLDLSGTGIFRYGMIKKGINTVGDERFLFGSDYPTCNPGMFVAGVLYEDISQSSQKKIFSENAERILGL